MGGTMEKAHVQAVHDFAYLQDHPCQRPWWYEESSQMKVSKFMKALYTIAIALNWVTHGATAEQE